MDNIYNWIERLLSDAGAAVSAIPYLRLLILLGALALLAALLFVLTKHLIVGNLYRFFRSTSAKWDDALVEHQVFNRLSHIAPAIVIKIFAELICRDFPQLLPLVTKLTDSYLVIVGLMIVLSFIRVAEYSLSQSKLFVDKPLSSYFQLLRIVLYITTGILVLSVLIGKSPLYFLSAFGAMTAIILLIFKDTILGLVASVQISANDMVRVGDWVEMPKFNADGDVIAINLNTVKIKNWDKTITTVPTFHFISDSFKNWRGMQESGGRRIKRTLHVNIRTIKFVDAKMRERFKKYHLLSEYIVERQNEIEKFNAENNFDTSELINGRRMTNIGVFRNYIAAYLKNHSRIKQDMTLMVRQMPAESSGIPIEIYCFTATVAWELYEEIQSDIFDHLLAAAAFFDLEIFQQPSGSDFSELKSLKM